MAIHFLHRMISSCPKRLTVAHLRLKYSLVLAMTLASMCVFSLAIARTPLPQAAHGVPGIKEAQLTSKFWLTRLQSPSRVLLTAEQIAEKNTRVATLEDAMHDLVAMPPSLPRSQVLNWLQNYDGILKRELYDEAGKSVTPAVLQSLRDAIGSDAIPDQVPVRYGLVVERAALRAFPTTLRVFSRAGDTDIDRFQESAEFPGTPVAIVHTSRDGKWLFVVSQRYAAWMEKQFVAEGSKATVLDYAKKGPSRVITAAKTSTVYTPEEPQVSELQLDMGVRIPLADPNRITAENASDIHINGQHPYTSWVLNLPVRNNDGSLSFHPALLPRSAESSGDYLPLTKANLLKQAFKFLGERYGWGHSYNGRDCSGFVSEVYRSMGILLPRNTSDQATSPGLLPQRFDDGATRAQRDAAIANLEVGDLIYIPGHVMMMIGRVGNEPYVIHDTSGGSVLGADGELHSLRLNGVVVTPLRPLMYNKNASYIDRMTSIVRIAVPAP